MREEPSYFGKCPIADAEDLDLVPENEEIVDYYNQAADTAKNTTVEKDGYAKVFSYIQPCDLKAILDLNLVENEDRPRILRGIKLMQEIANRLRASEKVSKPTPPPRGK